MVSWFRILTMLCTLRSSGLSILLAQLGQMAAEVQLVVQASCRLSLVIELRFKGTVEQIRRK
jgi:hypothetical protein